MIRASSRIPSLSVPLAVVPTTRQIQSVILALSWINHLASQKLSSPSIRVVASCRESASHVWFNTPGKHCVAARITRKICEMLWLLCLASTVSTEYGMGGSIVLAVALLVRTGGNGPSIAKASFLFLCAAVAIFLSCAAIYTHSTTNCQNIHP